MLIIDRDHRVVFANRAACRIAGRKDLSSGDLACYEVSHHRDHPCQGPEYPCPLDRVIETKAPVTVTHAHHDSDGNKVFVEISAVPILDEAGEVPQVIEWYHDITEHKRAEEALRCERDFAEGLLTTAQAIVLMLDTEGRVVRFNPYMERLSGYRLEEVRGKDWFTTFLPKRDQDHMRELFLEAVSDIQTRGNVNPIVTKDGREREIEWHDNTLNDADGNVVGLLSIGLDITERKRAEKALQTAREKLETRVNERTTELAAANVKLRDEIDDRKRVENALRESDQRFRAIADYAYDWESWVGPDGRLLWVNPAVERLTGYTPGECMAMPDYPMPMIHEDDRPKADELLQEAVAGSSRNDVPLRLRCKDGATKWMAVSWQPIYDKDGVPLGHRSSGRDITRRKQAEEREMNLQAELAHIGRLSTMGEMASGLAHELNQPLTAIALQADALANYSKPVIKEDSEKLIQSLKFIAEQAHRAGNLIRRMRQFVKIVGPKRSTITFNEIVDEVIPLLKMDLREAGIVLAVDIDGSLPQVFGDKIQLQQVLLNLVRNAIEAMRDTQIDQRRLNIKARPTDGMIEVAVRDTGCGIPADKLDRIEDLFGTFYTTKSEGMGIGLGISRSIVESHGGHLRAKPNPDRGATFTFTLPIPAEEEGTD